MPDTKTEKKLTAIDALQALIHAIQGSAVTDGARAEYLAIAQQYVNDNTSAAEPAPDAETAEA